MIDLNAAMRVLETHKGERSIPVSPSWLAATLAEICDHRANLPPMPALDAVTAACAR